MTSGIETYIPQRPPFVFIDTVEMVNDQQAVTRYTIPADNPLVSEGVFPLAGLMENAAQTCAVRKGNKIGYIGAVKKMEVTRFPSVGETLRTEAIVLQEVLNICLMEVKTFVDEEIIATTSIKLAIMDD